MKPTNILLASCAEDLMRKFFLIVLTALCASAVVAQDSLYTRQLLEQLCSQQCYGRGYVAGGLKNAEKIILAEIKRSKALPIFGKKFTQAFHHSVNTFPKEQVLVINGKALKAGYDYLPGTDNASATGTTTLLKKDSTTYIGSINGQVLKLVLKQKLTFSVGDAQAKELVIELDKSKFNEVPETVDLKFESKLVPKFESNNIGCVVRGTSGTDSTIVFTAHYDHLGGIGKTCFFAGANDNASGVSMVLNLLKYYSAHPPKYNTVFIFFAGEEAGLLGSSYFVQHAPLALNKIKFLINLDLLGTGDEGIMVVNGAIHTKEFERLQSLNEVQHLLPQIKKRGKAANSDHYWFTEKGVPCFFIYTMGGIKAYHDVYDLPQTLPLTKYKEVFSLLTNFIEGV